MVELEGQETIELGPETPASHDRGGEGTKRIGRDRLMLAILGSALFLALVVLGTAVIWGSGPILAAAPWYIPFVSGFIALIALVIAVLSLGRYQVLRDPLSFWVGAGYAVYGLGEIFYALNWPGLLPGGPILGSLPSTSAFIVLINLTVFEGFLLSSVLSPWPNRFSLPGNQWLKLVFLFLLAAAVGFSALILLERDLPVLVDADGIFSPLQKMWTGLLLGVFALGSLFTILYYRRTGERLAGFITFPQLTLVFICMMAVIGGKRYDLWWYLQRIVLVGAHLGVLYGLLLEYIGLLKRESEGRRMLEAILENIPVGLAVTGGPPDFSLARFSRHALEMNGQESEHRKDAASTVDSDKMKIYLPGGDAILVPPEQMPLYRASHFGEETRNMELVMETPEGRKIPVLVNAAPIHDVQGNITAAISTWLDITDRKMAEETLQASEALYRAIARSIPRGGVFVVDRNLRYVIAEGVTAEEFGISKEVIEGHTVREIFDREVAAKMEARFHRAFEGETISYETEHNGRIYWTQHAAMDEPAGHAIVITIDVTERKQAEKALSESEQRFRAIINQATAGILRTDIEGSSLFVNQALCEMLGYAEADLADRPVWLFIHPEDVEESRRLFDRLREKGKPFHLEERLISRDGSILWANVSAAPILDEVDRPQSVVFVVVDITERKQAEEALQQLNLELESRVERRTAELQAANWALFESRRRLQVLSQRLVEVQEEERRAIARELHDRVGQTLTALNLNLTIVNDQLTGQALGAITERLADSIKLVTEMIAIVRDVMSDLRPIVLDEYGIEAALRSYLTKFEARYDIHVEFDRASRALPALGPGLEMTILRIAQEALLNIARHAQADRVTLALHFDDEAMVLSVEDNGIGFQAWQTADSPRPGHGLMLMRERAEAVGGSLKISSLPSKGTRIEAYLPLENSGESHVEKEGRI